VRKRRQELVVLEAPCGDGVVSFSLLTQLNGGFGMAADTTPLNQVRLLYPLHRGPFATIFVARDDDKGRLIAIKRFQPVPAVLRPDAGERFLKQDLANSKERFLFELKTVENLSHPNLVRSFSSEVEGDAPFFAMPLHPATLWNELWVATPVRPRPRKIPAQRTLRVLSECLGGLAHLHDREIIHRDIHPTNFLLGQGGALRLADYSMAIGPDGEAFTPHASLGSARPFMSPELFAGRFELVDKRTDVFSMGVLAYRMVTGKLPENEFGKEVTPPNKIDLELDKRLSDWIMAALERQPQDRPQDARELLDSLPKNS